MFPLQFVAHSLKKITFQSKYDGPMKGQTDGRMDGHKDGLTD